MNIIAKDVAKLREVSGAGMMDCKKALEETGGDFDKAMDLLRKKGAKMAEKRAGREAKEGIIVSYIHNGRVGVLLELNCETDFVAKNSDFKNLAGEIALQIAAMNPLYLSPADISPEEIAKEKKLEAEKMKDSGKPTEIIGKIVEGKIDKYYGEVCLLKQPFFKDEKKTVEELINEVIAKIGEKIEVGRFVRYELGK